LGQQDQRLLRRSLNRRAVSLVQIRGVERPVKGVIFVQLGHRISSYRLKM
jgi:hypothetical protein